jgi:nucleoside-diphosphate-sugar epimerase
MAILITGGTGFLGRHLTRYLLQSGEKDLVLFDSGK